MADNSTHLVRGETPNFSNAFNVSVQASELTGGPISETTLSVPTTLATAASTSKRKTPAFQITSITIGSRSSNDGGDDSADDLDESHTDDMSDVIDSKITDLENETPSFSEDTFSREDVFFNAPSTTSLCPAPVIPTSAQYGLAIVPSEAGASSVKNSSANNVTSPSSNEVQLTAVETVKPIVTCAKIIEPEVKDVQVGHPTRSERFKVVKIESTEPFKRGRWTCMDYLDQPTPHQHISQMQTKFLVRPSVPIDSTTPGCGRNPIETTAVPSDQGSSMLKKTDDISKLKSNTTTQELNQPVMSKHQSSIPNIGSGQNSLTNYPPTSCAQMLISQQHPPPIYQLNTPTQSLPAQSVPQQQQTIQQSHQGLSVAQQQVMQQHSQIPNQQTIVSNQGSQQSQPTLLHHSLLPQQIQQVMASPNLQQYHQSYLTHQQAQQQGMIIHQQIMQQPIPQQQLQQLHYHQQMQHQQLPQMQMQFPQDFPTLQQTQMQQVYHQIPHNQMVGVQQQMQHQSSSQQIQQQYYYSLPTSGSFQVPVTAAQTLAGVHIISQPQVSLNAQTQPFSSTSNHNITQQVQQQSYQQTPGQQQSYQQTPGQQQSYQQTPGQQQSYQQTPGQQQSYQQTPGQQQYIQQMPHQHQLNQSMQVPPQTSTTVGVLPQQTQQQPAQSHQGQPLTHQPLSQSHMTNFVHQHAQGVPQQTFITQTSLKQPTMMQQGNLVQQQYLSQQQPSQQHLSQQQPSQQQQQQQTSNQPQQWNVASQQSMQAPVSAQVILSPTSGVGLSSDVPMQSLPNSIPSTFGLQAVSENVTSQTNTSAISKSTSFSTSANTGPVVKAPQPVMLAAKEEAVGGNNFAEGQNQTITEQSVKLLETLAGADQQMQTTVKNPAKANTTIAVAIDNKIEQAMDLVKTHLMYAVREEVVVLKEKIAELMERTSQLEYENNILRTGVNQETLDQLNSSILLAGQAASNAAQPASNTAQPVSNSGKM